MKFEKKKFHIENLLSKLWKNRWWMISNQNDCCCCCKQNCWFRDDIHDWLKTDWLIDFSLKKSFQNNFCFVSKLINLYRFFFLCLFTLCIICIRKKIVKCQPGFESPWQKFKYHSNAIRHYHMNRVCVYVLKTKNDQIDFWLLANVWHLLTTPYWFFWKISIPKCQFLAWLFHG